MSQTALHPGVYFDMAEDVYHSDPCERPSLSSSIGKVLLAQSPRHAWTAHPRLSPKFETGNARKFDLGKAVHAIGLEDKPERIAIIPHADYRTNAAKAARDDALAAGLMPLKTDEYEQALAIAMSMRKELPLFKDQHGLPFDGWLIKWRLNG